MRSVNIAIKKEIDDDLIRRPEDKIGYNGKSDQEIVSLLNSPVRRFVTTEVFDPPPIARILSGIFSAPNVVTDEDVTEAKKVKQDGR